MNSAKKKSVSHPRTRPAKMGRAKRRYLVSGHPYGKLYINGGWTIDTTGQQVSVLPRDSATQEAMIEQGAKAIFDRSFHPKGEPKFIRDLRKSKGTLPTWKQLTAQVPENVIARNCRDKARACFAAVGIVEGKK